MKAIVLLLIILLLSGCFIVVKEEDKVKIIGNRKEIAEDTLKKIEEIKSEEKQQVYPFGK